jgi:hypothetical protein
MTDTPAVRHINLTISERADLAKQQKIEQAVALFLDLQHDHTWKEIADALDLSLASLKRLTQTTEFNSVYQNALSTVGHDPRLAAITSNLGDLLPMAYRRLRTILSNPQSDDRVAMRAIEKLFDWTRLTENDGNDDPATLTSFLQRNGVRVEGNLNLIQINVPQEFREAFSKFLSPGTPIHDGEVIEVAPATPEEPTGQAD